MHGCDSCLKNARLAAGSEQISVTESVKQETLPLVFNRPVCILCTIVTSCMHTKTVLRLEGLRLQKSPKTDWISVTRRLGNMSEQGKQARGVNDTDPFAIEASKAAEHDRTSMTAWYTVYTC